MSTEGELNVTQPAEEVVSVAPAEAPPWEQKTTETPAPQQGTQQPATPNEQEEQRRARGGFQRRIDELVREREHERSEKQKLLDVLARQAGQQAQQPAPSATNADVEPKIENFDSYEKYLGAHARWSARQEYQEQDKIRQERMQREQAEAQQRQTVEQQQRAIYEQHATLNKITAEAEKKYPDFYEKVFEQPPDVMPISPVVGQAILKSKDGADIAYYLGTHPEEAHRIYKLDPVEQLVEIGSLRSSLAKQQSAAPAPINPISGKKATSSDLPSSNDDMKTWIAKRNRQLGRK